MLDRVLGNHQRDVGDAARIRHRALHSQLKRVERRAGIAARHVDQVAQRVVVNACAQAFEWVGMPEGQYHLAMATLYLATAPKSNSVGAYWGALAEIEAHGTGPVPIYLRDKSDVFQGALQEHYKRTIGEHDGYRYPHAFPDGWVEQRYAPEGVAGGWFQPKGYGYEQEIIARLAQWRQRAGQK